MMEIAAFSDPLAWVQALPQSTLLLAALVAMGASVLGTALARHNRELGYLLRGGGTLALVGILVLVVLQLARVDGRFDVAVPGIGLPQQEVSGGETRIPLHRDGHFWIEARVNDQPARFMVDTGATLTAISTETATATGVEPRRGGLPVQLTTANGVVNAQLASITRMEFGNIRADGLDAVIAPNLNGMNVVGMNLLSRLASWRVEDNVLILKPKPAETTPDLTRPAKSMSGLGMNPPGGLP